MYGWYTCLGFMDKKNLSCCRHEWQTIFCLLIWGRWEHERNQMTTCREDATWSRAVRVWLRIKISCSPLHQTLRDVADTGAVYWTRMCSTKISHDHVGETEQQCIQHFFFWGGGGSTRAFDWVQQGQVEFEASYAKKKKKKLSLLQRCSFGGNF